jgi:hypothetical protein
MKSEYGSCTAAALRLLSQGHLPAYTGTKLGGGEQFVSIFASYQRALFQTNGKNAESYFSNLVIQLHPSILLATACNAACFRLLHHPALKTMLKMFK